MTGSLAGMALQRHAVGATRLDDGMKVDADTAMKIAERFQARRVDPGISPTSIRGTGIANRSCLEADDPLRAVGAILGKALTPLAAGEGLVDMLVTLR